MNISQSFVLLKKRNDVPPVELREEAFPALLFRVAWVTFTSEWTACDVPDKVFGLVLHHIFFCSNGIIHLANCKTSRNPASNIPSENSTPNAHGIRVFTFIGREESKNNNNNKKSPPSPSRREGRCRSIFWRHNQALTSRKSVLWCWDFFLILHLHGL